MEELDISKIKIIPSDTEIPVYDNLQLTRRAHCTNFPENTKILENLQAVFNPLNVTECSSNLFNKEYETIKSIDELKKVLSELLVRFDTAPSNYTKEDYSYLMGIIYKSLLHLYEVSTASAITTEWNNPLRDDLVPSEKLTKETIDKEVSDRKNADTVLQLNINKEVADREKAIEDLLPLIWAGL